MMCHPDQQMHKLSKKDVAFSITYQVFFEGSLLFYSLLRLEFFEVGLALSRQITVVDVLVGNFILSCLRSYLQEGFNIGV